MKKLFDYTIFGRSILPFYGEGDGGDGGDGVKAGGGGGGDAPVSVVNADGTFTDNWHESFGEENKAYLSRFKDLPSLVKSNIDTKRKFGKDPNSMVEIPTDTSNDDVRAAFAKASGKPDSIEAYEYTMPDELAAKLKPIDDTKMNTLREFAHKELDMSPGKFKKLLDFYHTDKAGDADVSNNQMLEDAEAAKAEGLQVLTQQFKEDAAVKKRDANLIFDKYGLDPIKMPDGTTSSIKGELLANNPNLLTDPYFLMLMDSFKSSMSEDTLRPIVGSGGAGSLANIDGQINDIRDQMDKIIKENPVNFKGNARFKDLKEAKRKLYNKRQKPA